jgi:hypothetical protein
MINFDQSINALCKRKMQLMREIKQINDDIKFLEEQKEKCTK